MTKLSTGQASERVYEKLESLKAIAGTPGAARARQFSEALAAIQSALDEVEAVEAELAQQNEELAGPARPWRSSATATGTCSTAPPTATW